MTGRSALWVLAALTLLVSQSMCGGGSGESTASGVTTKGAGGAGGSSAASMSGEGGSLFSTSAGAGGGQSQGFDVEPSALQTVVVAAGQTMPTVSYKATLNGQPTSAAWGVDRGDIGAILAGPSSTSTFSPTGMTGGLVTVSASSQGKSLSRKILVQITAKQNGPDPNNPAEKLQIPANAAALSAGGGVGGVGGEGLGVPVTDMPTLAALMSPMTNGQAQKLAFLYPYDKTVWPRGMLAPLLMWSWATNDADAIQIQLKTTSGSFSWTGTFGRPAILTPTGKFIRHPIPQDIWDMATNTAGGPTPNGMPDKLVVSLTIAKGGMGYGPITETWPVAPARLTGTVYYNSYGTQLVKNWVSPDAAGHPVGAAILGVRSGDTGPTLVVGQNSPIGANGIPMDDTGCRVCHVVASRGGWLIAQAEEGTPSNGQSFLYDLTAANVQGSVTTLTQQGVFAWAAMVGDGSYALTNSINPSSTNIAIGTPTSSFWKFAPTPTVATLSGLPAGVSAGYPSYSPDDKQVAYIDVTGQTADVHGNLVTAAYDATTQTFSNLQTIYSPLAGRRIGYPSFFPDNSGLVFETEVRSSQSDTVMVTRNGARSELWWTNLGASPKPVALAALNGTGPSGSYLPIAGNNHGIAGATDPQSTYDEKNLDDTTLAYEPTVLPIVSGGYAWVVFTSRRLYGNQLTAVPWLSWPPSYDTTNLGQATVKKLWVAAIDLNAPPGSDPSFPAFYLPAQEILAGNSRGFWVLDPCKKDGTTCQTGDQCCNGYCEASGDGGALVCSNMPPANNCSGVQEKCTTAANCCDTTNLCINGFCSQKQAQ